MRSDVLEHVFSEVAQQLAVDSVGQPVRSFASKTPFSTAVDATDTCSTPKPSVNTSLPSRRLPSLAQVVLVSGLALSIVFLILALRSPSTAYISSKPTPGLQTSAYTKPIEQIQLGERVVGKNPDRNEVDGSLTDPDPKTWRTIKLTMVKANGGLLKIELLRSLAWLKLHRAKAGATIFVCLPEIGEAANAKVEYIGPCAQIQALPGNVVTGRFIHKSDGNLLKVKFVGQSEEIGVTSNHPFWSEDRKTFVVAGTICVGEKVNTIAGTTTVESITLSKEDELIYNLEVHQEHVYRVGTLGALVHNDCPASAVLHYTNREGFEAITSQRLIRANNGRIYVTREQLDPENAFQALFAGAETHAGRGDYVIILQPKQGIPLRAGTQPNEFIIDYGNLRFDRHIEVIYAGPNPFGSP